MLLRQREVVEWVDDRAYTGNETRFMEIGNVGSGQTVLRCDGFIYLTFGIKASHAMNFEVQTCLTSAFGAATDVFFGQVCPAVTFMSPYNIAFFTEGGRVVIPRPYIRLRLNDTSTAQHTYTRFYAKAWGE